MNIQSVQQTLKTLYPDHIIEIRILRTPQGTYSGYFENFQKAAAAIAKFDGEHNIYMTVNEPFPELIARSSNKLIPYAKQTTSDKDIRTIKYIMIDFDPCRSSGISATGTEKEKAKELMIVVGKALRKAGFSPPVICDSGNGYHLLYRVDLPNTDENQKLLKAFLSYLDLLYSNDEATIDTTTYNPSRITKVYGTVACKGDSTEDRPHRVSSILKVPDEITVTDISVVAAFIGPVEEQSKKAATSTVSGDLDVLQLIEQNNLKLAYSAPYQGGTKYIFEECFFDSSHQDRSAYIIQTAAGGLAAGCHHDSCKGKNWQTFKDVLDVKPSLEKKKGGDGEKQADVVIGLVNDAQFFKDGLDNTYMAAQIGGHVETMSISSQRCTSYLTKRYYEHTDSAMSSDAMSQAKKVLEMKALFSDQEQKLEKRMTFHEGSYYYDLCDKDWSVVRFNEDSVEVVKDAPTLFIRSKNMKQQSKPDLSVKPIALVQLLRKYFRFHNEADLILFAVYLVTNFIPDIAHVVLVLFGEKGAAKSTTMRMIKKIVDPAIQELLSMPSSQQDLALTLFNNYMPCFDNLDGLSSEKSDMLCMAATGGAITKRTLYTDSEETILEIKRPIGINGINVVATRADLLDRAILLELVRIPKNERRTERDIWETFDKEIPQILGGIFNTIKEAIGQYNQVVLDEVGRMADFTYWGYAIAQVMGIGGDAFLKAYLENQDNANEEALTSHPVAAAVMALLRDSTDWEGSVSSLLGTLEKVAEAEHINTKVKTWPKDANVLSKRLKEVKSNLEEIGIFYDIRHGGHFKKISFEKRFENGVKIPSEKLRNRVQGNTAYSDEVPSGLFDDDEDE